MQVDREILNLMADRLEMALTALSLPGRITGGTAGPTGLRFELHTAPQVKLASLQARADDLARAVGRPTCRVTQSGSQIILEFPKAAEGGAVLPLLAKIGRTRPLTALLGVDGAGRPLLLRLSSPDVAHVLIAGTTGSGKTVLARTILGSLALWNGCGELGLVLIDPKASAYSTFRDYPHLVLPVATTPEQAERALDWCVAEMERRAGGVPRPGIVVAIDELADLLMVGGARVEWRITRLVQRGREAGIHVIACTQRPGSDVLDATMKANFPVRIVGKVGSRDDARTAAGVDRTGAEALPGKGAFILVGPDQVRFQAAMLRQEELAALSEMVGARPGVGATWAPEDVGTPTLAGQPPEIIALPSRSEVDLLAARPAVVQAWGAFRAEWPEWRPGDQLPRGLKSRIAEALGLALSGPSTTAKVNAVIQKLSSVSSDGRARHGAA